MKPELLLQHFNRLSNAPDAVPRIRRFILDLAVRGKLVGQDPNDEPASLAYERIQAARVTRNRVERAKKETAISSDYKNFMLPTGWVWAALTDLVAVLNGRAYSQSELLDKGTPVLRVGNLFTSHHWYYSNLKLDEDKYCDEGDLIFAWSASFGPFIWRGPKVIYHYHIWKLALHSPLDLDKLYLYRVLLQKTQEIKNSGHGISMLHMTKEKMERVQVPLPPLAEQHRIVAKVNELMALCDQLDAAQTEGERRSSVLAAASIHHLNNGRTADAFSARANFCIRNLPRLTSRIKHVAQLRQALMTLGVSGRLNTQNSDDEPASKLLGRKAQLPVGYQRRRKILKKLSVAPPAEIVLQIPSSWEYRDVQNLYDLKVITDYADGNHGSLYPRANEFGDSGVTFVTAKDLSKGKVIWSACGKLNNLKAQQLTKGWAKAGDVLLTHNATVGRVARVEPGAQDFLLGTSVTFYRLNADFLDAGYFSYFLQSRIWQGQLEAIMQQTTRNQVSIQKQAFFLVAIPPLAEQHRIVAKVDELMALCDGLEDQLGIAQIESGRLLDAVLNEALNGGQTETPARLTVDSIM